MLQNKEGEQRDIQSVAKEHIGGKTMKSQINSLKIDKNIYGDVCDEMLDITGIESKTQGTKEFIQKSIFVAKEAKLKYIVGKLVFNISLDGNLFASYFGGEDSVDTMNRLEFSEDKKDWHKVTETPEGEGRLKKGQRVYYRYTICD